MKLKLDENLNERGIALLAAEGHDVSTVVRQEMQAAVDAEVVKACRKEGRALVTLDLDFANPLRFRPSQYPGIAVLRLPKRASADDLHSAVRTLAEGLRRSPWRASCGLLRSGEFDNSARKICARDRLRQALRNASLQPNPTGTGTARTVRMAFNAQATRTR